MKRVTLTLIVAAAILAGRSTSAADAPPPAEPDQGVVVESGRVVDRAVGFSFALPAEWQLDPHSKSGVLTLKHPATGSSFSVLLKPEAQDLETEFKGLRFSVPFLGGRWSRVNERWTKMGKLKAGELESLRTHDDGKTWHEWNLVSVRKSQALLLWFSTPDDQVQARRSDLTQMLKSFEWPSK